MGVSHHVARFWPGTQYVEHTNPSIFGHPHASPSQVPALQVFATMISFLKWVFYIFFYSWCKNFYYGAREMAQQFGALAAFAEAIPPFCKDYFPTLPLFALRCPWNFAWVFTHECGPANTDFCFWGYTLAMAGPLQFSCADSEVHSDCWANLYSLHIEN